MLQDHPLYYIICTEIKYESENFDGFSKIVLMVDDTLLYIIKVIILVVVFFSAILTAERMQDIMLLNYLS